MRSTTTANDEPSRLWFLNEDVQASYDLGKILVSHQGIGVLNGKEIAIAQSKFRDATKSLTSDDVALPKNFPALRLAFPNGDFGPDYFVLSGWRFCSNSLRMALAQPENIVQFTPVDLVAGGEKAGAKDYQLMRVLTQQSAMDLRR
jgi:hypothetical protein